MKMVFKLENLTRKYNSYFMLLLSYFVSSWFIIQKSDGVVISIHIDFVSTVICQFLYGSVEKFI